MVGFIKRYVNSLIDSKTFRDDNEVYLYLTLKMALLFAALIHFGLAIVYAFEPLLGMVGANIAGVALQLIAYAIVHEKRNYYLGGLILVLQVLVYGTASYFLTGFDTYNIFYVVLVVTFMLVIPFASMLQRTIAGFTFLGVSIVTTILGFMVAPLYPLKRVAIALAVYNVAMGILGIAFELVVVTTTKKVISHATENKLGDMIDKANSDTLTGLYNRRYAHIYFDNLLHSAAGEVWCVAMLDVDNFKSFNDKYGHLAGDKVLSGIADIMRRCLRSTDSIFRWGGEEFLIVLKGTSMHNAVSVLKRMLKTIEQTEIDTECGPLSVTATVGVTVLDIKNIQASIDKCDARLYIGKRNGKNQVVDRG